MEKFYYIECTLIEVDAKNEKERVLESTRTKLDTKNADFAASVFTPFGYLQTGMNHMIRKMVELTQAKQKK